MIIFLIGITILAIAVILNVRNKRATKKEIIVEYYKEELEFLKYINTHRKTLSLTTLKPVLSLDLRAKETVQELPPVDRHYNSLEIVGGGHKTLSALFIHYLKSDAHRNTIEHENFNNVGIGIKIVENKYYNVTIFSD
jgi:hypothetical protein